MIDTVKQYINYIIIALVFGAGWYSHDLYSSKIAEAIALAREEAAVSTAEEIAKIQIVNTTIQQKVIEHVRTEVVYSECHHSPDTYSLIKDAFGEKK